MGRIKRRAIAADIEASQDIFDVEMFVAVERGEIGPDLFRVACNWGLRAWWRSELIVLRRTLHPLDQDQEPQASRLSARISARRRGYASKLRSEAVGEVDAVMGAQLRSFTTCRSVSLIRRTGGL
jgi:hypothetical protein